MNWLEYVLSATVLRIFSVLFSLLPIRQNKVVFASARSERLRGNMRFIHAEMERCLGRHRVRLHPAAILVWACGQAALHGLPDRRAVPPRDGTALHRGQRLPPHPRQTSSLRHDGHPGLACRRRAEEVRGGCLSAEPRGREPLPAQVLRLGGGGIERGHRAILLRPADRQVACGAPRPRSNRLLLR